MAKKSIIYRYLIIFVIAVIPLIVLPGAFEKLEIYSYLNEVDILKRIVISSDIVPFENIHLIQKTEKEELYAFIPAEMSNFDLKVGLEKEHKGVIFADNEPEKDITDGCIKEYTVYVNNEIYQKVKINFWFLRDVPTMYVNTQSGSMDNIHLSKDNKEDATFAVYYEDGKLDSSGKCSIKGRGNSSWVGGQDGKGEKKPYNISIKNDTSFLGMKAEKKWCLLASYDDKSFLRNKIAFTAAARLGCDYTPETEYVNLYTNGEYKGLYMLTQRPTMEGGCIANSNGYLMEFDIRCDDVENWFYTGQKNKVAIKNPSNITDKEVEYIRNYMNDIEKEIYDSCFTEKKEFDTIDVDSWAKMYVINDFFVNCDVAYSSFFVYKSENNSKVFAGPVWDFELSMGMTGNGEMYNVLEQSLWLESNTETLWLNRIDKNQIINNRIKEIYANDFLNIIRNIQNDDLPKWINQIRVSAEMDAVLWDEGQNDFGKEASDLSNWINERMAFECDYLANPNSYEKIINEYYADRGIIYCEKIE